jgi:hypothetical protein
MSINPAPIQTPVTEMDIKTKRSTGFCTLPWISFFNSLFTGDTGTTWTPTATNLTVVGAAPTITGKYYRSGQFIDFTIRIVPGTNTSATAGTTYFSVPFNINVDGANTIVSGLLAGSNGMCDSATDRIYPPAWAAVTVPLTIVGRVIAT